MGQICRSCGAANVEILGALPCLDTIKRLIEMEPFIQQMIDFNPIETVKETQNTMSCMLSIDSDKQALENLYQNIDCLQFERFIHTLSCSPSKRI